MRFRPVKHPAAPQPRPRHSPAAQACPPPAAPPQMDNPYSRHFTRPRTLDSLRRGRHN